ncbi:MAG: beta strand repeat-containing protein, partial [Microcoleaceae cyanobacterium]
AGNISVNSSGKIDITGQILATSANLAGGNVTLKAVRNIDTSGAIFTNSENNSGAGGNVLIESTAGIVNLQQIETNGITAGNISLKGREINLLGGNNSVTGKGGEITILTANPDQNILLGGDADTGANILNLTNIDLRTFQNGWEQITIGSLDSTGNITVNSAGVSFADPIRLKTSTGNIVVNGILTGTDNAEITLDGNVNLNNNITTNNQNLTITGNVLLGSRPIQINTGDATGAIAIEGSINGKRNLTLNSGTGNITVGGKIGNINSLGALTINSTGITEFKDTINTRNITTNQGGSTRIAGNVTTTGDQVYGNALQLSGNIELNSISGKITSRNINNSSGSLKISAPLDITTGNLRAVEGEINIDNAAGTGNITTGNLLGVLGVNINSTGAINLQNVESTSSNTGGDISIISDGNIVSIGDLTSIGTIQAGNIFISGEQITAGAIDASSIEGNGGTVGLIAQSNNTAAQQIPRQAVNNDIQVVSINTQGAVAGGNINLQTDTLLQVTGILSTVPCI